MTIANADPDLATRAAALHEDALVWDNHGCMPFDDTERWLPELVQYRRGGVDVAMINIGDSKFTLETTIRMAARLRAFIRAHPDQYVQALRADDIVEAKRQGKLAVGLNVEGFYSVGEDLSLIELYYDLGVRWMLMVYNVRNLVGAGCHDNVDEGLTDLGRRAVAEMDRVGMVKCCTHTGYRTAMDVLTGTARPTIFSHSNPRALRDHPRNIPDELIDACAATGGVVCINGVGIFLGQNEAEPELVVRHLDHVVQRVGARHAGLGLDYVFDAEGMDAVLAQGTSWPEGYGYAPGIKFLGPEALPAVTEGLLRRGYADDDVRQILGGNLLRVAREVWR